MLERRGANAMKEEVESKERPPIKTLRALNATLPTSHEGAPGPAKEKHDGKSSKLRAVKNR